MKTQNDFAARMKDYEYCYRIKIPSRSWVMIRLDGKSFHTWTKKNHVVKPFSSNLYSALGYATSCLVKHMQNVKFAYLQSDEVSLVMNNNLQLNSEPWFGNNLQKIASVSASILTARFNEYWDDGIDLAFFDSRVWVLPNETEVVNYFIWRQQDAVRNSIQSLGHYHFSQKELYGLSCNQIQEKLWQEKEINWDKLFTGFKRGNTINKDGEFDHEIPIFTEDKNYILKELDIDNV